jgi:penicillin-binding protein 1C
VLSFRTGFEVEILKNKTVVIIISVALLLLATTATIFFSVSLPVNLLSEKESTVIYDRNGEMLRVFTKEGFFYLPYNENDEIPEKLKKAVLFYEDRRFGQHFGIDLKAIVRAAYQNITKGRIHSGASTITMQLCRLMTQNSRTFRNKTVESIQALKIERKWNKDTILRKYLTYCPYGQNIYGYKTASLKYFRKEPSELNWAEAALLAILPNAPGLLHPEKNRDRLTNKRDRLLKRMLKSNIITKTEYEEAILIEPPKISVPFQTNAWHLTRSLERRFDKKMITTTLDRNIQLEVEQNLRDHANENETGFSNFASLVVNNRSAQILAWVGSHNFFDDYNNGQVDALVSRRPVDGLLQPFLYALAIDEGIVTINDQIPDKKHKFGSYTPTNIDGNYKKTVTAAEALKEFRNVPAVYLLDKYGVENFYTFLKEAGARSIPQPPEYYKYSLISGGFDLQPVEIASLYSGLARGGDFIKLKTLLNETGLKSEALFSKSAAEIILKHLPSHKTEKEVVPISASCNRNGRECWSVLISEKYTVLVWGGKMSGNNGNHLDESLDSLKKLSADIYDIIFSD